MLSGIPLAFLAQAVKRLYPDTKCAIGPAVQQDSTMILHFPFFYGGAFAGRGRRNAKNRKRGTVLEVGEKKREEALTLMKEAKEDYKVEMIEETAGGIPGSPFIVRDNTRNFAKARI